jgi:tryptophanyl-tRNA synthetase
MRIISGIQATGTCHLGNYLGALKIWAEDQHQPDALFFVADLHSLTIHADDRDLDRLTIELVNSLLAVGLDPQVCTLFVQSQVEQHTQLGWLMECTISMGELQRMTQFKDKSGGNDSISAGLFTYPALQAADILLYDVDRVPVGDDQRQHLELTRDAAIRFNHRVGREVLVVPEASIPRHGARVRDLQDPSKKMSKSATTDAGVVYLTDEPDAIIKKFKRAVTDTDNAVAFDPDNKPGVSNLLTILSACGDGTDPAKLADQYSQYGALKADTADAVIARLGPIRARLQELSADDSYTRQVLNQGADKARTIASATLARAKEAVGLYRP